MIKPTNCRDCGKQIWFAKSSHKKWFPLEYEMEEIGIKGKDVFILVETDDGLIAVRPGNAHVARSHIDHCTASKVK